MSAEIQIAISSRVANGAFSDQFSDQAIVDQATIGKGGYVQSIGTTEEVVNFGDVATNGYCILKNLDTTHYVTFGPESSGAMVVLGKLKAGEVAVLRIAPTVVLRAKADTASVKIDVRIYED